MPVEVGADSLRDEAGVARGVTVGHARRRESSERADMAPVFLSPWVTDGAPDR